MKQVIDDMNNRAVRLTGYDFYTIAQAPERPNNGDLNMSQHERAASAFVNDRMDRLEHANVRQGLVSMGQSWAHTTIEIIFDYWKREMELPSDHQRCPSGDQQIFTRRRKFKQARSLTRTLAAIEPPADRQFFDCHHSIAAVAQTAFCRTHHEIARDANPES